jgi:diguanylate cyclase (GGDEF)-like protein
VTAAADVLSGGLLVAAALAAVAEPELFPALGLVPLLAMAVALLYRPLGALRPLVILCFLAAVAVALAGELVLPRPGIPLGSLRVLRGVAFVTGVALVLVLLWRFSTRLSDSLTRSEAGNLALKSALEDVKRAEEQIRMLAYHDAVTGLPNRLVFDDRLQLAVAQAQRQGSELALLFIDLDRFKVVNDSLGHAAGDALLRAVAERLVAGVRAGDTVARLGGDEFVVLLPGADRSAAVRVAEKIRSALRPVFRLDGHEVVVTSSVGITLFPEHGTTAEMLAKNADVAMYHAKLQGRDAYRLYASAMNAGAVESLALEGALRRALERQELSLHYQPILDLATRRIRAVEALLRWRHPTLGLVWPADFIPLAEVTGLIHPIAAWVLDTACAQVKAWHRQGYARLIVSVNVSSRQFQRAELPALVRSSLRAARLRARFLELEITESCAMQDVERAVQTLKRLKDLGVRVAIDDFGIGHSSLRYLKLFPVDTLKIDGSLLGGVDTDPKDAAIVKAVIGMAHSLGLHVVAEGVETVDQQAFLAAHRCDRVQGFLLSHPVPAEECEALLAEYGGAAKTTGGRVLSWPSSSRKSRSKERP